MLLSSNFCIFMEIAYLHCSKNFVQKIMIKLNHISSYTSHNHSFESHNLFVNSVSDPVLLKSSSKIMWLQYRRRTHVFTFLFERFRRSHNITTDVSLSSHIANKIQCTFYSGKSRCQGSIDLHVYHLVVFRFLPFHKTE